MKNPTSIDRNFANNMIVQNLNNLKLLIGSKYANQQVVEAASQAIVSIETSIKNEQTTTVFEDMIVELLSKPELKLGAGKLASDIAFILCKEVACKGSSLKNFQNTMAEVRKFIQTYSSTIPIEKQLFSRTGKGRGSGFKLTALGKTRAI